jgi:hypothetical protein
MSKRKMSSSRTCGHGMRSGRSRCYMLAPPLCRNSTNIVPDEVEPVKHILSIWCYKIVTSPICKLRGFVMYRMIVII